LVLTAAAVALAFGAAMHWAHRPTDQHEGDRRGGIIQRLSAYLVHKPCDRSRVVSLAEQYTQAGNYAAVLENAAAFTQRCGMYPRLEWTVYEAHKRLGHWDEAAQVATTLIEQDPTDKDYWWWRGVAYEQRGELEKAAVDYRQALTLMPWLDHVPVNLANVLDRLGRPCEAASALRQFVASHPDEQRLVQPRLERLRRRGGCKQVAARRAARRVQ
jgi:Flp pilus assembly protein TadD